MKNIFSYLILAAILLVGILFPMGLTANAQLMDTSNSDPLFVPSEMAVMAHLESMLKSRDAGVRVAALQDVTLLASKPTNQVRPNIHLNVGTVNYQWQANLSPMTPHLLTIFRTARHPGERIMAANALYLIGDEASLDQLIELNKSEPSKTVQKRTNKMLVAHYTSLYPELRNGKKITTAKIKRAKRVHARAG